MNVTRDASGQPRNFANWQCMSRGIPCPTCSAASACLNSRLDHMRAQRRRRYQCVNGHRFTTHARAVPIGTHIKPGGSANIGDLCP